MAPCIFDKLGGGGGEKTKELKGFVRVLGAVVSQFTMGMVCCTRTAINYGYFIAIRRVFRESFGSPLNPRPQAKTTFSSLCKC